MIHRSGHRPPRRPGGYTLVEILVAVAILGLVSSLAAVTGLRAIQRAKQSKAMDDMADIQKYIAVKAINAGAYPAALTMRLCPTCAPVPYERKDPWGHLYVYTGTGGSYTVRCLGRDGILSAGITPATRDQFDLDIVLKDDAFINNPFHG